MAERHIAPEKVTKPIQLLAAWLVGLIVVNASFLLAAQQIGSPSWAAGALVVAAIANVPIFIAALFLLQTKFRPQMQEDSYYAQYLRSEREFSVGMVDGKATEAITAKAIEDAALRIANSLGAAGAGKEKPIENILRESQLEVLVERMGNFRTLSELYLSKETWSRVVQRFEGVRAFKMEVDLQVSEGLVSKDSASFDSCELTELGRSVARAAEKAGRLFSQTSKAFWESERISMGAS
jgi:hypothetical protein